MWAERQKKAHESQEGLKEPPPLLPKPCLVMVEPDLELPVDMWLHSALRL